MNILYVAERINADDGSSVHCRSFVENAAALGNPVRPYPEIRPIVYRHQKKVPQAEKDFRYYLSRIDYHLFRRMLRQSSSRLFEVWTAIEGVVGSVAQLRRLERVLERFPADVIIYRNRLFNFAPYWLARKYKLKIITEINSLKCVETPLSQVKARPTPLTMAAERYAIAHSDRIVCVSTNLKRQVEKIVPEAIVSVVPNGVDTAVFDPRAFDKDRVKKDLGLSGKFIIGYTGSYQKWHGLDRTVEVAERLAEQGDDDHFILIGDGVGYAAIAQLIREKNLNHMFTQIKALPHAQMPRHLSAFDCALMTYPRLDGFYFSPLKMFEYMAMEVPVISTAIGQIGEIIEHGETGLLVDDDEPGAYARILWENRDRLRSIGEKARRLMELDYSWRKNAERVTAAAKQALN